MCSVEILLDHPEFVVVNKPIDVGMHGPQRTIIDIIKAQTGFDALYLVHRLDTATSGCLLLARNATAAALLSAQFANKEVQKYYIAIIDQKLKKKQGKISGDMSKTRGGSYKLAPTHNNPATTFFFSKVISHALNDKPPSNSLSPNVPVTKLKPIPASQRLVYLKPITGKTHQLRVALKSLGCAILGDTRYKGSVSDRMYLHSHVLAFSFAGETFFVRCWPQQGLYFSKQLRAQIADIIDLPWPKYIHPVANAINKEPVS